jgi:hypothetical protein
VSGEAIALDRISVGDFAAVAGTEFQLALEENGPATTTLVLREATPAKHIAQSGRQPFSIYFDGPAAVELPQGMYWLTHERLGQLGIFIVPIGADIDRRQYEAVFN